MTLGIIRSVMGCALVALAGAVTVWVGTFPSRASFRSLETEANNMAERHRALSARILSVSAAGSEASLPEEAIWRERDGISVEIALQQTLVASAGKAGLELISFGAGASAPETKFPTVFYEMEMTGDHEGLARFLAEVEAVTPALAISYLWLRQLPQAQDRSGAPITIRLSVWGFRDPGVDP